MLFFGVRAEGLEPPCLTAPDPKSGTSTNFATPGLKLVGKDRGIWIYPV
jgi:hypothetical protein